MISFRRNAFPLLLFVFISSFAQFAIGQSVTTPEVDVRFELADVIVDGRLVMKVRGTASFPAERRAAWIRQNIIDAARDSSILDNAVTVKVQGEWTHLMAGNRLLVDLMDADAEIEGLSREILAQIRQELLNEAITSYRNDRQPRVLLRNTAYALATILISTVLIFGFWKAFRHLSSLLKRRLQKRVKNLEEKSARFIRSQQLFKLLQTAIKAATIILIALILYFSLNFVFGLFPWTRGLAGWMFGLILNPLQEIGAGIRASIPSLFWLAILFIITRYLLEMTQAYFKRIERGAIKLASFDQDWAMPTFRLLRLVIILFAVVMAYPHIPGSGSEAFKGIGVLLGLMISLGSTSIIGNIIAGYSLTYRRPFKIGDRIKINDKVGEVSEIRVLTTRLSSPKNEEIVIPNTNVLNGEVINYSKLAKEKGLILHTSVGIGYETPWRQVEAMLKLAADRTPNLLKEPEPFVLRKELGDYGVAHEINAYCNDPSNMARTYSTLHDNILDVFNEYDVVIMTPSYVADTSEPKLVPKDEWYTPPAKPPNDPE